MIRVAINGFGRIGTLAFRSMITGVDFDIVAINAPGNTDDLAYLLKHDTVHGNFHVEEITNDENNIIVKNIKRIKVFHQLDPENLPWKDLNIDLVLECSGKFTDLEGARKHINAGAKKVLISAPGKDTMPTIVYNVNDNIINPQIQIYSAASCTTNCLAPVLKVINDNFGIEKGYMSTIHAITNDQNTLDGSHSKGMNSRRGRTAAANIIPTTTGAAKAIGLVIPDLLGKMDGYSFRVPVMDGSMIDLTLELKRNTTVEEINNVLKNNQNETIAFTMDPVVSSDIIGSKLGSLVDGKLTSIVENNGRQLVKIVAWYDNEVGYTAQMMRTAKALFR